MPHRNTLQPIDITDGYEAPPADEPDWHDAAATASGFLRADSDHRLLPPAEPGPMWTEAEATARIRTFLHELASGRPTDDIDDPVEFARANSLLILFGASEHEAFEGYLARMPEAMGDRWRDLLAGGARSEAFGPLTLEEKLDERQVEEAFRSGRKQRLINVSVAVLVLVAAVVGGFYGWRTLNDEVVRTQGTLRFATVEDLPAGSFVAGGAPITEPALTVGLSRDVAIVLGEGPAEDRIVTAPFADYLFPPGAISASLFSHGKSGEVVFVGPGGFPDRACLIASVATSDLRPLDTVWFGNCLDPVGRPATVRCLGVDALALELKIPEGAVELPEGGTGFADAVRIQSISDPGTKYETLSARATITVPSESEIVIPAFGGVPGEVLDFDLGQGRSGSCALTSAPVPG